MPEVGDESRFTSILSLLPVIPQLPAAASTSQATLRITPAVPSHHDGLIAQASLSEIVFPREKVSSLLLHGRHVEYIIETWSKSLGWRIVALPLSNLLQTPDGFEPTTKQEFCQALARVISSDRLLVFTNPPDLKETPAAMPQPQEEVGDPNSLEGE